MTEKPQTLPPTAFVRLAFWRPGAYLRTSGGLLGWMLLRATAQAATVFVLARVLGGLNYGKFVAVLAVASFLPPFIGLGLAHIVLRNGAKDAKNLPFYLQRAVYWWLVTVAPGIVLSIGLAELLLPAGLPLLAAYAAIAAELMATSLTELSARHRQAAHRINAYGAINAGLPLIRLVALCLLLASGITETGAILWTYASSSLAYTLVLARSLQLALGRRTHSTGIEPMSPASGLPLSLAAFAMRLQSEFNKPLLAQIGFDLAGAYNVAQRATDLAVMPLQALQESLWPRLYSKADPGQHLRKVGVWLLALAAFLGICIWTAAPILPLILGHDFGRSAAIVRLLAWLPLLQMSRALINFRVIYHNRMTLIGWACAAGAIVSVVGVTLLVPSHGAAGAILSAYASELTMIICLVGGSLLHNSNQTPSVEL